MKKELTVFFSAVLFYTRIPCPKWVDHNQILLEKATRYFPLIGWIVGGGMVAILYAAAALFPLPVAVLLSMATGILLTGAFHEDGFADVCDGFGGGWTKEKILLIMKDSRMGAYGTIGLILLLLLKFYCLWELASVDLWKTGVLLVLANALSRYVAVLLRIKLDYVREQDESKAKPIARQTRLKDYCIAAAFAFLPFLLQNSYWALMVLVPLFLLVIYLRWYFTKWIGGYTGDCLGATQQLSELVIYLFYLALWNYT